MSFKDGVTNHCIPIIKMSSASEENLLDNNDELPGGISNPVFYCEEPSSPQGQDTGQRKESNPVLNVEEASSGKPSPEPEYFVFDQESIQRYKSQPRRGTVGGGSSPPHRKSLVSQRRISDDGDVPLTPALLVPDIHHSNHGIQFTNNEYGEKATSYESFPSEGRLHAPPTPGLLNINGYDKLGHPPPSPGLLSTNSVWSELGKLHSRRSSTYTESNESSFRSGSISNLSSSLSEHLHYLVRAFSSRTERVKASTVVPPTPSTSPDVDANSDALSAISNLEEPPQRTHRIDSFIPGHKPTPVGEAVDEHHHLRCCKSVTCRIPQVFEPQSKLYMTWLFLVTLTFMYNSYAVPLRAAFKDRYMNKGNTVYWLTADYIADLIYILDILVFKPRLTYLVSGLNETDVSKTRKHYMKKSIFKFDMLSLMPLDIFYFATGINGTATLLRLPRMMKIQTFWEFYQRCDQAIRSAHILRILKTITYMVFLIHIETCGYYSVSLYEGFDKNDWVYNGQGNAYIRCFYLATKTATSIGKINKPTNELEYVFMIVYWLSGVFVFALLVGQIRDIVESAQRVKTLYDKRMETALRYVKNLNLPKEMQEKVRVWFLFNWQQQKVLDEKALMDTLPIKLRTDLAIHVHFNTLSKVKLFQDCDKSLLYNLVLKLKPILYLPGEYVCRKGEVGKEMYIVSHGIVEVVGGPENSLVFATLTNGSVFGEISLLSVGTEGNRRTADVRVKGFTNLFMLSKADFESAMSEFPTAHKMLKKRARKLLAQNAKMTKKNSESSLGGSKVEVEEIFKDPREHTKTPKLLQTVLQVMNPESDVIKKLGSSFEDNKEMEECKDLNTDGQTELDTKMGTDKNIEETRSMTAEEVEDFFDEILRATESNPTTFDDNPPIKRDITVHTEDSIDSGVQVNKQTTSPSSSIKTISNKDSKESCISVDDVTMPQKGRVALLAEFFEDSIHNDSFDEKEIEKGKEEEIELHRIEEKSEKVEPVEKTRETILNKKNSVANKKKSMEVNEKPKKDNKALSSEVKKNNQPLGLLTKPGSKRPNFMTLKNRKITPEIQISSEPVPKAKGKKISEDKSSKTVKTSVKGSGSQKNSLEVHRDNNNGGYLKENKSSLGDTDSIDRNIMEIMNDELGSADQGTRSENGEPEKYERRISKIEASISSLNSEIEKADALLRDLCSEEDDDLIKFSPNQEGDQPQDTNDSKVIVTKPETKVQYTIPAKNQITCSVDVHREKTLTPLDIHGDITTPISLSEWIEKNASDTLRNRKHSSSSSIETGV